MIVEKKICVLCGNEKPIDRFAISKGNGKEYRANQCKDCNNERAREWRHAHPEIVRGWDSKKYQKGRPESLARQKRYYAANKERISEVSKEYRLKNGDRLRAQARAYHKTKGPEVREQDRIRSRAARYALKIEVLMAYGGVFCQCCNEIAPDMLTLDHVNNDGAAHRKSRVFGKISTQMYRWARRNDWPPIFRVMCFNCNIARVRTPGNVCPHEIERLKLAA